MAVQDTLKEQEIRDKVREGYAAVARNEAGVGGCCGGNSSCGGSISDADALAQAVGYSAEELSALPDGANMGLSCGNPVALASLREGETVLDLGSGGGFDVFLAGPRVGSMGRVIGVDMTPDMIARARRNSVVYTKRTGLANVEFRLGEIEALPAADSSVDVVISNCVINLSPDKPRVWREIARVLKPGGRVAVSDIVLKRPLPEALRESVEALVGCIAGAMLESDVRAAMAAAGLVDVELKAKASYVEAMEASKDPLAGKVASLIPAGETVADYIASMDISARKSA